MLTVAQYYERLADELEKRLQMQSVGKPEAC
jgi:hypothetical protein